MAAVKAGSTTFFGNLKVDAKLDLEATTTRGRMDDSANTSDGLDALANLLTELSVNSFDINLHVQHINMARSLDMEPQVVVAQEMAASFLAVGDDVWLPLIQAKTSSANLENPADVLEVLELYTRAEADYLCA